MEEESTEMPTVKMIEDLARSGLTKNEASKLKLKALKRAQTKKEVSLELESYKIPYFNIDGKMNGFYRIKLLESKKGFGGSEKKKAIRYTQPKGSDPRLYFPPLTDWKTVAKDPTIKIVITEGEKKAAKACSEGIPTIGLGGVWTFRSKKNMQPLIPDFDLIDWRGRETELIFDSDLKTNSQVSSALLCLAKELSMRGSSVSMGFLPTAENGDKMGLDDFLVAYEPEELENIELEEYELSAELWELNEEIAIVRNPPSIYQFSTNILMNKETLIGTVYADRCIVIEEDNRMKRLNAAKEWMKWPQRRTHAKLVYEPGLDPITEKDEINTWEGWGCKPKRGDIRIWNEFIDYIFSQEPAFKKWFLKWAAYPIQHPGTKLYTCVLMHGITHGTGKSFIGEILGKIYGTNYQEINEDNLHSSFNEWCINKQLIMGEEITGGNNRKDADRLKHMITRHTVTVNMKFRPSYPIRDCINYFFTSNRPDAMFVEQSDRRIAICEAPMEKKPIEFYRKLDEWKEGDGPAALFYHLLHNVSCKDFDPKGPAPDTQSKADMRILSMGDIDMFVSYIKDDADSILRFDELSIDRDLFTIQEIVDLYDRDGSKKTTCIAMSKALRRAGFKQLPVTKTAQGAKRLYALRNTGYWKRADHTRRAANYDGSVVYMTNRRKKFSR